MLLKFTITVVLLLVLFIEYVRAFDRIIEVTKLEDRLLVDQDETVTTATRSGSALRNSCCIFGNCSCESLYSALANLNSNVLINITTDVELSSVIQGVNLANITITGYNNPTVNCNNSGGLHFISCSSCTIEGITWKRCGAGNISGDGNAYPILQLTNSSNITIQHCSYQYSIGQAVILSEVLGDVNVNYCSFLHAKGYKGHGTAIHYSSYNKLIVSPINITISKCNFLYNKGAKSIVYFGQPSNKHYEVLNLRDSEFGHNQGVPIYLSNQDLHINGNVKFHNNIAENGGAIFTTDQSNVIFHKSGTVEFTINKAIKNGGAIFLSTHSNILFKGYSTSYQHNDNELISGDQILANSFATYTVKFYNNTANGLGQDIYAYNSNITVDDDAKVVFNSNVFLHSSSAVHIDEHSTFTFKGDSIVTFRYNIVVDGNGGALYIDSSTITFEGNSIVIFNDNQADNGGALYIDSSTIIFKGNSKVTFNNNQADKGGALFIDNSSIIIFEAHSIITFNKCWSNNGGVLYIDNSDITFKGNSKIEFNDNTATNGAMYIDDHSAITFEETSTVSFNANKATNGGALYIGSSVIIFKGNSKVTFDNNQADKGGAVYITYFSTIIFEEHSITTFSEGWSNSGGAVYITDSVITFKGNSLVMFYNNGAYSSGGAVYTIGISSTRSFICKENSIVTFSNNKAENNNGGAVYNYQSTITFEENCTATFSNNSAASNGGVMYIDFHSSMTFEGNSLVTFNTNKAYTSGGALYIHKFSSIKFDHNSSVTFNNNKVNTNGGAMYIDEHFNITFARHSTVAFNNNEAIGNGGAVCINYNATIIFENDSTVTFNNNKAVGNGGALYISVGNTDSHYTIKFVENSTATFNNNEADNNGGAVYINHFSITIFQKNSSVTFDNNKANNNNGGAVYIDDYSNITFEGNSMVMLYDNMAYNNGGAMFVNHNSNVIFKDKSTVTFYNNTADNNGGAFYTDHNSTTQYIGYSRIMFNSNTANLGGSVFSKSSSINIEGNASVNFIDNAASQVGGAIYLSEYSKFLHSNNSSVNFYLNTANDYGRDIYALIKESSINFNSCGIHFKDNTTLKTIHESIYIKVPKSCNSSCLFRGVHVADKRYFQIATSPHKLILYNPAKCINGNSTDCDAYYISNVMLGEKITFDACVLDYYDQPTKATQFLIKGMNHKDYNISGSDYITISCNHTTQGITLIGNLHLNNSYNYSLTILLYVTHVYESKIISVNLTVEISQCRAGFWYFSESQKCECYDNGNIISCSDSNSTIKRGYWFGNVNGKSTVTICPNDYCDFSCCEITNGIYHLSPVRANQCRSHRSGTACGNCKKGYTLSFDSPECVEIHRCTTGQTILVITLSLLYWIAVMVTVFVMMYFKVTIGSLYAIIYYYSVVDNLLSQVLFISNELYTTVNIMSSFAKLTPQFLGQLCLVQNMSGIDQQFIHYVHPVVISFILIMISIIARRSHRVSLFISRGIIHFICFLLLLSYTSVATTSLLLMRPLMFMDVDKVYTYLSPDIEYFHGRHIVYIIVAMLFAIVIVIGFPFLLLFEPCLNSKINFVKIKPLLDQFQGCYKDRYRCFAGYYMICRLVIILLVIVKISDDFTTHYLLISSCTLMALIHVLVKPYVSTIHNAFDGIILHLIIIISTLTKIDLIDIYDETFVLVITYCLVVMPLTSFIAIKFWLNRKQIQNAFKNWRKKWLYKYTSVPAGDVEELNEHEGNETVVIIDDNMRRNAIIVDV